MAGIVLSSLASNSAVIVPTRNFRDMLILRILRFKKNCKIKVTQIRSVGNVTHYVTVDTQSCYCIFVTFDIIVPLIKSVY